MRKDARQRERRMKKRGWESEKKNLREGDEGDSRDVVQFTVLYLEIQGEESTRGLKR